MKHRDFLPSSSGCASPPRNGRRGLKLFYPFFIAVNQASPPRNGRRGLKQGSAPGKALQLGHRLQKWEAWIETIKPLAILTTIWHRLPGEAWIETIVVTTGKWYFPAPPRNGRRGLKPFAHKNGAVIKRASPPRNGRRGLKPENRRASGFGQTHRPQKWEAWIETAGRRAILEQGCSSPPRNGRRGLKQTRF